MLMLPTTQLSPPDPDRLGVLTTTLPVVLAAPQVRLDAARVATVAEVWAAEPWPANGWDTSIHFFDGTERTLNWMALLDALNFCFWGEAPKPRAIERQGANPLPPPAAPVNPPRWRVQWRAKWYNGYNALAVALRRAVEAGHPLWDAGALARMDAETLGAILRPDADDAGVAIPIPLFAARLANTRELGRVLLDRYDGQFANVIMAANHDAVDLALRIAADFPSFNDIAPPNLMPGSRLPHSLSSFPAAQPVPPGPLPSGDEEGLGVGPPIRFLKRAQILVSDIASAFGGRGWGRFANLGDLTAFADYKVPQLLRRLGILAYADDLAERIDRLEPIPPGSPDEVAIRAATVWGVEWLRRALAERGMQVTASAIDYRLWLAGQLAHQQDRPYHRTRTIFY